jgi:hypothetical protein
MRYDDSDPNVRRWTNAKLMREAKRLGAKGPDWVTHATPMPGSPEFKRLVDGWAETWLLPVLDEIERRFVKSKKAVPR